jgi:cutinase
VTFDLVRRWALAVVTFATATLLIPAPSASADPCPDIEVVFARGTSEPAGIGRVGQALADALQAQIAPRVVGTYGVIYPATYDFLTAADGAADATNHISAMAAQCPNTRIVLGGYSQGAAVVDMLAGVPPLGDKVGNPVSGTGAFAGRSIDLCSDGDPICSRGRNPFAHTHYESSDFIPQAAGFVASRV